MNNNKHLYGRQRVADDEANFFISPDIQIEKDACRKAWRFRRVQLPSLLIIGLCIVSMMLILYATPIQNNPSTLPLWIPGQLDIHHLRVGPSESTFVIFPDGTTLLIDSGEVDIPKQLKEWEEGNHDLQIKYVFPNDSKTASGWVIDYMKQFWPHSVDTFFTNGLDYVLLTHFHTDHMGDPTPKSLPSMSGNFMLNGIPEIGEHVRIHTLLDRGFPNYDQPTGLIRDWKSLENYKKFTKEYSAKGMEIERFLVGSTTQIRMRQNSDNVKDHFLVRNIKGNLEVVLPSNKTVPIQGKILSSEVSWDENELSNAIVIEYGNFRYYEGGDQESHFDNEGKLFDTITPTARAAGMVDVATLNHHGHGVNAAFSKIMDPKVAILQGWCSDQPPVESMKYLSEPRKNNDPRHLFATDMFKEHLPDLGDLAQLFVSTAGHVVVRVHPPKKQQQTYNVFVLDENRNIESTHGPYYVDEKK